MNIHRFLPVIVLAIIVYMLAIPVEIMDVDAAQYASMGREMLERGDFLHVFDRGNEYLDKPPFIFWITTLSYSVFGIGNFAFKFPAILFAILGLISVFKFTKLWYDRETAILAAVLLATTQGYFHFTNDVRTDVYLTNSVIACVWMLSEQLKAPKSFWWIPAFVFAGIGMLAKGPLGLIAPTLAIGTHLLIKKDWKAILNWRWIAGVLILALVLSPMLYGLYTQFDIHPEKVVNGRQEVSGLRFFFWEQSFGRLTGENVWKNDSGPFFFVHSFAWSFLPWSLFFVGAMLHLGKQLFTNTKEFLLSKLEWISLAGFWLPFIALSASRYKLPHYIYVVFPFAAVISANYLIQLYRESKLRDVRTFKIIQTVVLFGCWTFACVLFIWFFPIKSIVLAIIGISAFAGFVYLAFFKKQHAWHRLVYMSLLSVIGINILLALQFYPSVLSYQAGGKVGTYIHESGIDTKKAFNLLVGSRALDVYAQGTIADVIPSQLDSVLENQDALYFYTNDEGKALLESKYATETLLQLDDFSVTLLRMNFGNPKKRPETLRSRYFIKAKN